MRSAVGQELTSFPFVNSYNSHLAASCEQLAWSLNVNCEKLLRFSLIWTWLHAALSQRLPNVPESYLSVLSNRQELILVKWRDCEAINASHSQGLVRDSFLVLQVPAENWFVSGAWKQVDVVGKDLNFSDFACMLFQVGDEFTRPNLPNSDFTFLAAWNDELLVVAKGYCSDSILVSIIDLPELLAVVHAEGSDFAVWVSSDYNLVSKQRANWINTWDVSFLVCASGFYAVVIGVPESECSILRRGNKLIRDIWHVLNMANSFGVVFSQQHRWEVTDTNSVHVSFICSC